MYTYVIRSPRVHEQKNGVVLMQTATTSRVIVTIELSVIERQGDEYSDIGFTLRDRNMELHIIHLQMVWNDDLEHLESSKNIEVIMNKDDTVRYVITPNRRAYDPECVTTP